MITVVRDEDSKSIARLDVNNNLICLSVGIGAYQFTELTTEQTRELALNLMVLASKIADKEFA